MSRYAGRRNGGVSGSIQHVVCTTSGCFLPEAESLGKLGGRPQFDKCGCRVWELLTASFHDFRDNFKLQEQLSGVPVVVVYEEPHPPDDRYIVLQARRNRRQTAGEIARHTTQATGRPISRFTLARRLRWWSVCTTPLYGVYPLTPAHRRRRSPCVPGTLELEETMNGDEYYLQMRSRFSLVAILIRILIWRKLEAAIIHSNIIERDRYGGRGVLVWGGIMLGRRTNLHIFNAEALCGSAVPFHGRQCTMSSHSSYRTALESEDIERMVWPARSRISIPSSMPGDFLGRRLAARRATSNDSGSFDWRCKTNGQRCLNNSLIPSFSACADAVKPA
ncbi:hypothetical protein TNCV_1814931 [Trichonephila clavipes]|nr:hypothetical protein TNCV_1814931 [Trichonephila clavipes]